MALAYSDERTLLLPLITGMDEQPVWQKFLQNLAARTSASRVCLLMRPLAAMPLASLQREVFGKGSVARAALAVDDLADCGVMPLSSLRPERVYALQEMLALNDAGLAERQAEVLDREAIAFARFVRIPVRTDLNAWLILTHERTDFGAADSALLSALVPYLAASIATFAQMQAMRLRGAMAEEALAMLGVGQAAFDSEGRVLAADDIAMVELDTQLGNRPALSKAAETLYRTCNDFAGATKSKRRVIRHDNRRNRDILLRPARLPLTAVAAIGLVRQPRREDARSAAATLRDTLGLSASEAALAEAISRGTPLVAAGEGLQLTPETARNYSKRIYAKTGASGQADLVRLVLSGLAPFS